MSGGKLRWMLLAAGCVAGGLLLIAIVLGIQAAGDSGYGWCYGFGKDASPKAFGHDGAGGQIAWADPESGVSFCYLTNGLDRNILREKRRTLGIGSRAAKL